jgi:hypothetical protein
VTGQGRSAIFTSSYGSNAALRPTTEMIHAQYDGE